MTEPVVVDADQRARALDIRGSFIVQAPAGSGKTELLTQRYLRLLAEVANPEEIYAITFTRKAAAEMRNRILGALERARGPEPEEPHRRLTWGLARAALGQDARHDWQITANPHRLRIQTFDSLSHALARQMPLLSELGAPPATTERPEPHYRDAARATLRQLEEPAIGDDIVCLLTHLDNRVGRLEDLLCDMLARRDQWLPHAVAGADRARIGAALEDAVCDHLRRLAAVCDAAWLQALTDSARLAATNLADDAKGATDLPCWHDRNTVPSACWADLPAWLGLADLLLTAQGTRRRAWDARLGFPAPSGKGLDADAKASRQAAKAKVQALAEQLDGQPAALALWAGLRLLPRRGPDERQQAVLDSLFRILLHATAELQLVFRERGEVDFAEIQMRAQQALGRPQQPTDLTLSLDYRLQHLLVDEFQDTSSSQYRLLETLTAGWQAGDARTLFAVGDPMQSIYRFREAEVGLYLAARERGIGELPLTPLTLAVNFRSTGGIVGWVNRSFPQILPSAVDPGRGAVPYAPATAFDIADDDLAVQVHPFAANDAAAEAQRVVELVRTALAETATGEVAVLARARSHLHAIAAALKAAGLGFRAVEVDPLTRQPVVRDLHALTRALLHPADRLSWLVVLRAPFVGLSLADLLQIAEHSAATIPARLADPAVHRALSDDGRRRVGRLLTLIDGELPARRRRPLRQWVEGIWLLLGGLAAAGPGGAADAQAYLGLLDVHEQARGLADFARLDEALERLYATPDSLADGRIQLMTMHKSKGLEFDTVILPGLGRRPRGNDSGLLYWLERTGSDGRSHLLMAPIRATEQQAEPISDYLRALDRDKEQLETARLLYVAATRAKRRLHLLGHISFNTDGVAGRPTAGSLLEKLWPAVEPAFAALEAPPDTPAAPADGGGGALWRLPADWRPDLGAPDLPAAPAPGPEHKAQIEFDWAGDTARHVGTLVHRHLERIATAGVGDWPAGRVQELRPVLRRGLQNLGVDPAELEQAADKALRAIAQTLADETGRWVLDAHAEARCEWPLTLHGDTPRRYVIDRTFVDAQGVRWIIDYKTGEHLDGDREAFLDREQTRYREQLETYAAILRLIEQRPIRLALYFPLFPAWRVWDYIG